MNKDQTHNTSSNTFVRHISRTHYCGHLTEKLAGQDVVLMGWVDVRRDHGGLIFFDLRDRSGIVQVIVNPKDKLTLAAKDVRGEYVVAVQGKVRARPQGMINKDIPTGTIEVEAIRCEILSEAKTPPFQVSDEKVSEMLRLKYRYLDLRSTRLQKMMILRHEFLQAVRQAFSSRGFLEIETPILYKSTPEGARDYLVPSRVHPGQFYALPQSPQTLKQLLMISGYDRYFQIARCFRDEDLRADRQPEFTQVDVEMSFVDQEHVMSVNEDIVRGIWKQFKDNDPGKFPRISFHEAMDKYGSDKPDLRIPWELKTLNSVLVNTGFKVFDDVVARKGAIKALAVPEFGDVSRARIDKLTATAKQYHAKGLIWLKKENGTLSASISKFFDEKKLEEMFKAAGGTGNDLVLIVADDFEIACNSLGHIRVELGHERNAVDTKTDRFLWVTDFPLLEYDIEGKRWVSRHHPFTSPSDEDMNAIFNTDKSTFGNLKAKAYDLVCNGYEIAGGSIRIHNQRLQAAIFGLLGMGEKEIQNKFGFFIEALQYGTPPHGGIAWGVDRLVMILAGTDAIRDVIAFPKTTKAQDMMADAPSDVAREQLLELGIRIAQKADTEATDI